MRGVGLEEFLTEPTLWGLWGGTDHGGWCSFRCNGDTYRYAGTRDEALAGKAVFNSENGFHYEVIPFDSEREPIGEDGIPTPAQATVLRIIDKEGTINNLGWHGVNNWRATVGALHKRGWYMSMVDADGNELRPGMRLTGAGRAALRALSRKSA